MPDKEVANEGCNEGGFGNRWNEGGGGGTSRKRVAWFGCEGLCGGGDLCEVLRVGSAGVGFSRPVGK